MSKELAVPETTAARLKLSLEALERQQVALNHFIEGVAAGMDVPEGYRLDTQRMVWVAPATVQEEVQDEETN